MTEVTINAKAEIKAILMVEAIDRRTVTLKFCDDRRTLHAGDTLTLNFTADVPVITATPRTWPTRRSRYCPSSD